MTKFTLHDELKEILRKGKLIPFVGAGVSMSVKKIDSSESLFPSWKTLLLNSAEEIKKQNIKESASKLIEAYLEHAEDDSYLQAAKLAEKTLGNNSWNVFLKQQISLSYSQCEPSSLELAASIWKLNCPLIITTNYDKVLDWACPETKKQDLEHWDIEAVHEQANSLLTGLINPTVWHLHGRISNTNNLIITPDGYTNLYSEDGDKAKYAAAQTTLKTYFTTNTLLFIGFSFDDKVFSNSLKAVSELFDSNSPNHYVLIKENQREKIEQLKLPLIPITYKDHDDLPELLNQLSSFAKKSEPTAVEPQRINTAELQTKKLDFDINNVVFNLPYRQKGDGVVGRGDVLLKLREQLTSGQSTNIGHAASFKGMGGLGKTQLAVEYAYKYKKDYPNGIFWIEADSDINTQLLQMAEQTKWFSPHLDDTDTLNRTLNKLQNTSDCLIIFDNVESHEQIKAYLPTIQVTPHLLITSRIDINGFNALPLTLLTPEQSVELLLKESNRNHIEESEKEHNICLEIVYILGYLPLAIELAGAYCKKHSSISFPQYKKLLDINLKNALPTNTNASFTSHQKGLFNTLSITEHEIAESPLIKDILLLLSWSATASMGTSLMAALLNVSEEDLIEPLALGIELRLLSSTDNERFAIHRLLKEIQRELHPIENMEDWAQIICQRMISWFEKRKDEFLDLKDYQAEINHLENWEKKSEKNEWYEAIELMWLQAYPLWHLGQYQQSYTLLQSALELFDNTQTEENKDNQALKADLLSDFATIIKDLGQPHLIALEYEEKALDIRLSLFGNEHPDTADSYNNIGGTYAGLGNHQRALEYQEKAFEIRLNIFGEKHPDTATSYNNIGGTYTELGNYQRALEFQEKALAIWLTLFDKDHPDTAIGYNNIGGTYNELKKHDKALEYQEKALAIMLIVLGEEHPNTSNSYVNAGNTYRKLGNHSKALEYQEKGLEILLKILGKEHPDTSSAYNNMSYTYGEIPNYDKALEFKKKSLAINITNYLSNPDRIINNLQGIVKILILQQRYTTALDELKKLKKFAEKNKTIKHELKKLDQYIGREAIKSGVRLASSNNKKKAKKR